MPTTPLNALTDVWSVSTTAYNAIRMTALETATISASNFLNFQLSAASTGLVDKFAVNRAGSVSTGSWAASAIGVAYGGTGATTAPAARTNLGLGTMATAASADYLSLAGGGALSGAVTSNSTLTLNGAGGDYIVLNGSIGGTPKITMFNSGIGSIELMANGGALNVNATVSAVSFISSSSFYAGGAIGTNPGGGSGGTVTAAGVCSLWSAGGAATYLSFSENGIANRGVLGYGAGSADLVLKTGGESFAAATTERFRWISTGKFCANYSYTDGSNYQRAAISTDATSITLAAETAGTGADNISINLTPAGTGQVVCGLGRTALGTTTSPTLAIGAVDTGFYHAYSGGIVALVAGGTVITAFPRASDKQWNNLKSTVFGWTSSDVSVFSTANDAGVGRNNAGVVEINNGVTVGAFRDLKLRDLIHDGQSARSISVARNTVAATSGADFAVQAGGAYTGGTDLNGGNLILKSGITTGTGTSNIQFNVFPAGSTGTTDGSPVEAVRVDSTGNVGIGTTAPTNLLSLGGDAARTIWMERTTGTAGYTLTVQAGGAKAGETDTAGGDLYLLPGISTGSAESGVVIQGCPAGASSTTDGTPSTMIQVLGDKLAFFGVTPVIRQSAPTAALTDITFTAPGTPNYAIQDVTDTSPFGFVDADEARTFISVVANLQTRVSQLESIIAAYGLTV